MMLIGFILNLAAITATVTGNALSELTLSPSDQTVVRYTNESLIVQCLTDNTAAKLHWKSPKHEVIREHKGRIHIEQASPESLKIVFAHIALADKGNWSCESSVGSNTAHKSFDLIVYQKITFTENSTMMTVKEGQDATILCEVKGEPQPNITWHYNGQPISFDGNSTKFRVLADGLLIKKVTQNDTGEYTCRAFQVNPIASDMQERTVLMKIEHKPHWVSKHHDILQYAYINGTATITCEAAAEPPANFTWHRGKRLLGNDTNYTIETAPYWSTLTIRVRNDAVFDNYHCNARNPLGNIDRATKLQQGEKPPVPSVFQLRGFNSNTFDVDVGSVRSPQSERSLMEVNGFRIEYMSEDEFKSDAGKWTSAKRKDFPFEDGATFLISNLDANTTYLMRAASRNRAGFSDWTKVERFRTLSNEPPSSAADLERLTLTQLLCVSLAALLLCKELAFGFPGNSVRLTKLAPARNL